MLLPAYIRIMEEDAEHDEDVAKVVDGTDGDPDAIRENVSSPFRYIIHELLSSLDGASAHCTTVIWVNAKE